MPRVKKENVLLVDNHPVMLKYAADLLEKNNYSVKTADDGLVALDMLQEFRPDYIFVDLIMPNIDGASLCRILRKMPELNDVPIFVLSAIAAEEACNIEELGVNACIAKGPLAEMGENILTALDLSENLMHSDIEMPVFGLENLYPRGITEELLVIKRHFEIMLESISDGILEINAEGRIIFANSAASTYFSLSREQLLGNDFIELFTEKNRPLVSSILAGEAAASPTEAQMPQFEQNGKFINMKAIAAGSAGDKKIVVLNDVTAYEKARLAIVKANEELEILAKMDGLTQIANRRAFDDQLNLEWRRMIREDGEMCIMLCDVDHFKDFNDRHGHMAGDELLRAVAQVVANNAQRPGDLAARYGGDEFALILPNTPLEGAEYIAQKILDRSRDLELFESPSTLKASVTLSIGICHSVPSKDISPDRLLSTADAALYEAKNSGRNCITPRSI